MSHAAAAADASHGRSIVPSKGTFAAAPPGSGVTPRPPAEPRELHTAASVHAPAATAATLLLHPTPGFIAATGPVDPRDTLIVFDVPYAPLDPRKSMKLRQRLGLPPLPGAAAASTSGTTDGAAAAAQLPAVPPQVPALLDSLIPPREWIDDAGTRWVQHASPYPSARADVVHTRQRLQAMLEQRGARTTGVCAVRSALTAECLLEVLRQVVAESWERGLLLLRLHSVNVARQTAHRELFESRMGFAFRLALRGQRDVANTLREIAALEARKKALTEEEDYYRRICVDVVAEQEQQVRVDEKVRQDELVALKKEAAQKRTLLEILTAPPQKK